MKYEGQIETYRFIGDSSVNRAKKMVKGEPTQTYTQSQIIEVLNNNKHLVCGGSKLKAKKNDTRLGYAIYYGKDKTNPDQIIKIVLDKESLEKGDVNALAIDSICQHSIRINKINNKKLALYAVAGTLGGLVIAGSLMMGMMLADKEESKQRKSDVEEYQQWLHEQRIENGTYKSLLEEQGLIDSDSVDEILAAKTNGRSF